MSEPIIKSLQDEIADLKSLIKRADEFTGFVAQMPEGEEKEALRDVCGSWRTFPLIDGKRWGLKWTSK